MPTLSVSTVRRSLTGLVLVIGLAGVPPSPTARIGAHEHSAGTSCVGLSPPVEGPVVHEFAPVGRYAGHWGIDFAVPVGTPVRAAASGTVSFVGRVADNLVVTVRHGDRLRTSYSYLSDTAVLREASLVRGAVVGTSGRAHDAPWLHVSVRVDGVYVDPRRFFGCQPRAPGPALRLVGTG